MRASSSRTSRSSPARSGDPRGAGTPAVRLSAALATFFARGWATELVLAVMLIEALALVVGRRRRAGAVAAAILPGALIVLALHAALIGAGWPWIALALTAALPAHLLDLRMRGWLRAGT